MKKETSQFKSILEKSAEKQTKFTQLFDVLNYYITLSVNVFIIVLTVICAILVDFISQKQRVAINCNLQTLITSSATEPLLIMTGVISVATLIFLSQKAHYSRWIHMSKIILVYSLLFQFTQFNFDDLVKSCSVTIIIMGLLLIDIILLVAETGTLLCHAK